MLVYRWQHKKTGFGPLCGKSDIPWEDCFRSHVYPDTDDGFMEYVRAVYNQRGIAFEADGWGRYNDLRDHVFAWNDLDLFIGNLYFEAEEIIESFGFEMTVWELSTDDFVVLSDGQVFFNRDKATRVA